MTLSLGLHWGIGVGMDPIDDDDDDDDDVVGVAYLANG